MALKWKRENIENLILSIQRHPCIYNVKSVEYLDRTKKALAFNTILEELIKKESRITLAEIKRKWRNIRTQFVQELRMMNHSKKNNLETAEEYVPKLWCFEHLRFLKTHTKLRENKDNTKVNNKYDESNLDEEFSNEGNFEAPDQPCKKRRKPINLDPRVDDLKRLLIKRLDEKTDHDWLGKQVVFEMKSIKNKKIQRETAWKIQTILREAAIQDAAITDFLSEKPSNEHKSDTQSSFSSCSPKEDAVCSSYLNDAIGKTEYTIQTLAPQPCPIRIMSAQSFNNQHLNATNTSYLPSPDILQQSMDAL